VTPPFNCAFEIPLLTHLLTDLRSFCSPMLLQNGLTAYRLIFGSCCRSSGDERSGGAPTHGGAERNVEKDTDIVNRPRHHQHQHHHHYQQQQQQRPGSRDRRRDGRQDGDRRRLERLEGPSRPTDSWQRVDNALDTSSGNFASM